MDENSSSVRSPFKRDSLVWSLYLILGLFSFTLTMISPVVPFLRAEFHLDYTMAALHLSMYAIGMVLSGVFGAGILARLGSWACLWGGMGGSLLGTLLFVLSPSPYLSLGAILLTSLCATLAMTTVQSAIASLFPAYRAKALIEANVMASVFSAAPPFLIILGSMTILGWRILAPVFALVLALTFMLGWKPTRRHGADPQAQQADPPGPLPAAYWINLLMVFFGVATEWCAGFWAAEYLKGLPGGSLSLAAAGVGVFQIAAVAGRFISSRLAGRIGERALLAASMLFVVAGFPLYWLRLDALTAFIGLGLCGAGVSTFYPLTLSLALESSGSRIRRASSYVPIAAGSAIALAPLVLGRLADGLGLRLALWAVPIGLALMTLLFFLRQLAKARGPRAA